MNKEPGLECTSLSRFLTRQYDAKLELLVSLGYDVIGYLYTVSYLTKLCKDSNWALNFFVSQNLKQLVHK